MGVWGSISGEGKEERRTDGGRFNHVANGESLDCLVLGRTSRAVGASNRLHVASSFLVAAAVVDAIHYKSVFCFFSPLLLGLLFPWGH